MTAKSLRSGLYLPPFGPLGDAVALVELAVRERYCLVRPPSRRAPPCASVLSCSRPRIAW